MKKLIAIFLIAIFSLSYSPITNAQIIVNTSDAKSEAIAKKTIIIQGNKLKETIKGKKYKEAIDTFIQNATKEKIKEVQIRVGYFLSKTSEEGDIITIAKYLYAKTNIALYGKSDKVKTKNITKHGFEKISDSEIQQVNKDILLLQKNIYISLEELLTGLEASVRKTTNYKETGAFEMDIQADMDNLGSLDYSLDMKDYSNAVNGLDQKSETGDIHMLMDIKQSGQEDIKLDLVANFESILKKGELFLLLKKFEVSEQKGLEDMKNIFDKLKELKAMNTYLAYTDANQQQIYNLFGNYNKETFLEKFQVLNTTPLMKPQGKINGKYVLVPNQDFCNFVTKFNTISSNNFLDCEKDFPQMMNEFQKEGTLYLDNSKSDRVLSFVSNTDTDGSLAISYNQNEVKKITLDSKQSENNYLHFEFINSSKLEFVFNDKYTGNMTMKIDLNTDNTINNAMLDAKLDSTKIKGSYKDKKLEITFNNESSYSTFDADVSLSFDTTGNPSGTITSSAQVKDYLTEQFSDVFTTDIKIKNTNIEGSTIIKDFGTITHNGKIDTNYFKLENKFKADDEFRSSIDQNNTEVTAELNLEFDTRDDKNNFLIDSEVLIDNKKILQLNMKNISKIEYNTSVEIEKPTKVIDMEDFIKEFYNY